VHLTLQVQLRHRQRTESPGHLLTFLGLDLAVLVEKVLQFVELHRKERALALLAADELGAVLLVNSKRWKPTGPRACACTGRSAVQESTIS